MIIVYYDNLQFIIYVTNTISNGCYILDSWKNTGDEMHVFAQRGFGDGNQRDFSIHDYVAPFAHHVFREKEIIDYEWKVLKTTLKQVNTISCRVFACMFLEHYTYEWALDNILTFSWVDSLKKLRIDICRDIIMYLDNLLLSEVFCRALKYNEILIPNG